MKTLARTLLIGAALPLVTLAACSKTDTPATTTTASTAAVTTTAGSTPGTVGTTPKGTTPGTTPKGTTPPGTGGTGTTVKAGGAAITAKDFAFTPDKISVKAGDSITFTNEDTAKHEPTSGTPSAKGDAFTAVTLNGSGTTGTITIAKAGTYPFYCAIHEGMTGTITVT